MVSLSNHEGRTDANTGSSDASHRRASLRAADGSYLAAPPAAAEEAVAAVGFKSGDADALRHLDAFEHFARPRIDAPDIALVALPGAVQEFVVDPGHSSDEAV